MKFRTIRQIIVCVMVIGISAWGISQKQTYTRILEGTNALDCFYVAEFPESLTETTLEDMQKMLPNSGFIIRATATGEKDYLFMVNQQEVLVQKVYQGEGMQVGEKINIVAGAGFVFRNVAEGKLAELGFVNEMREGQEYLIFLEKKINHLSFYNTNAKDTYQVMPTLITPIFGYEDRENVIIDIPQGTSTYVQYSLVRENEFFVTSKQALTTLIEMKHRFLNTYPKEN